MGGRLAKLALGLNVGGAKIEAAVVDADGLVRGRARVEVLVMNDRDEILSSLVGAGHAALSDANVSYISLVGVGCGCAGPMVWPEGIVSPLNIPAWKGFPLRDKLMRAFSGVPLLVHNDAIALTVGEHWKGRGKNTKNMVALTVSTGVGGGFILNGRLFHGGSGNAGHVGHIIVEPDGPSCPCGSRGCLEAVASVPSTVRRAIAEGWSPPSGVQPDGRALAQAAADGDRIAERCLARAGSAVGVALATCANTLDLEVAILAGGFSMAGPIFWNALRSAFSSQAKFEFAQSFRIEQSTNPRDVYAVGAAAFVLERDQYGWAV